MYPAVSAPRDKAEGFRSSFALYDHSVRTLSKEPSIWSLAMIIARQAMWQPPVSPETPSRKVCEQRVPKKAQIWVATMVRSIYQQRKYTSSLVP